MRSYFAQVAFIREDMAAGRSAIDEALKYISRNSFGLSEAEIRLKKAQAHLICATMQLAPGKPEEAHTCMKDAYEVLQTVPETPRRHQLDEMLENLMRSYINSKNSIRPKTFEEYEKEFREPQPAPVRPKAPAEAES